MKKRTEKLPGDFEGRYKSEKLKDLIADEGMWGLIPAVTYSMNSPGGIKRLEKNHPLFAFIDEFFGEDEFAFEPNMMDDRFVFLPADVGHQGMGVMVSNDFPGFLEAGHFWYPAEFTQKVIPIGPSQVYVPIFSTKPGKELSDIVRKVYMETTNANSSHYCTFPFSPDHVVTLSGDFMDNLEESVSTIRNALKDAEPSIKRNGEGLIGFMERQMK